MLDRLKGNRRWVALGALVALNVLLITLLFIQHTNLPVRVEVGSGSAASPVTSVTPLTPTGGDPKTASQSARPSMDRSPAQTRSSNPSASRSSTIGTRRLIAANSAKIAWRAVEGDCDNQSIVEVTKDGGRTWRKTQTGIRGIVRLQAYGDSAVFAVGADRECKPTYAWITSPDTTWRSDQSVTWDVWYRYPGARDRIHAPGGRTFRPCGGEIVTLAGMGSEQAAVLCEDGRIRTIAGGRGWRTSLSDSGGIAISTDNGRFLVVRVRSGCNGILLQRFDAREVGRSDHGICRTLPGNPRGQVAAATVEDVTWVWVGRDTVVS